MLIINSYRDTSVIDSLIIMVIGEVSGKMLSAIAKTSFGFKIINGAKIKGNAPIMKIYRPSVVLP